MGFTLRHSELLAMSGTRNDIPDDKTGDAGVQDDFHPDKHAEGEERRLHLRAFDYWHSLKGDGAFPLFKDLSPEGLAPFKNNSLLLEFTEGGATVRFIGNNVGLLLEEPITKGTNLSDFPQSAFAQALLRQFEEEEGRSRAAEFEFIEDLLDCRGIMMPFSHTGGDAHFSMVVVNFRRREGLEAPQGESAPVEDHAQSASLDEAAGACRQAAKDVVHLDGGSRSSLYKALAAALALFEEGERNKDAYSALLKDAGLKAQKRAPFTPALKLTFGRDYDKTRLTEYASALAYARRQGETSETLAEFLDKEPGGIKGCVRRERSARRGQVGSSAERRQAEAAALVSNVPGVSLDVLSSDKEFSLVIARPKEGGGLEAVGLAEVGQNTVDAVIRRFAEKIK